MIGGAYTPGCGQRDHVGLVNGYACLACRVLELEGQIDELLADRAEADRAAREALRCLDDIRAAVSRGTRT